MLDEPKKKQQETGQHKKTLKCIVIGAGVSGILMGIKLLKHGIRDFVILEKAETLGGTWRDNVYPGIACDVPAHLYVYSFAPNPSWRTTIAGGADIWKYYHGIARRYGVLSHIIYNQEVALAEFQGADWRVTTKDGTVYHADIVISATGRLHHPSLPDISGVETFAGSKFHSARWNKSISIAGKRVGIIGTGSTATQIVSNVIDDVGELNLFQRTPQWIFPLRNGRIPWWQRLALRLFRPYARRFYYKLQRMVENIGRNSIGDREARRARDQQCINALNGVRDEELRKKLTPSYDVGCKRLVMSETFYDAVQRPNFKLVVDPIERIEPRGVLTRDGKLHELDVLVLATGFKTHAYMRPMTMIGENGISLDEVWQDLPITYRALAIPHMPNFFMLNGPYSPGGTASIVGIVEVQSDYLMQLIDRIAAKNVLLTPRPDVCSQWLEETRDRARHTVWGNGGCNSWYLDKTGTPAYDPSTLAQLTENLAAPKFSDFNERPRPVQP